MNFFTYNFKLLLIIESVLSLVPCLWSKEGIKDLLWVGGVVVLESGDQGGGVRYANTDQASSRCQVLGQKATYYHFINCHLWGSENGLIDQVGFGGKLEKILLFFKNYSYKRVLLKAHLIGIPFFLCFRFKLFSCKFISKEAIHVFKHVLKNGGHCTEVIK